ncbi:DUF1707 domain-containing protein [Pseudonocardia sp.]|uniref:DUF1707 domain-containing protein n=1 Tax=Pseudonocardia sp. TaxID=60912 RepID=UPI003D140CA9
MATTPEATLAPQRPLRCSDAERDTVADRLRTVLTEGRLTAEETGAASLLLHGVHDHPEFR